MSTVVSVRVRKRLKEEAERLGVNLRKVVEEALISEIERRRSEEFKVAVDKLLEIMKDVDEEEFAGVIKEWRRRR
jgi:post-segregation antitoxin (ccd killing protein)